MEGRVKVEMVEKYGHFGAKSLNGKLKKSYDNCVFTFSVGLNRQTGLINTGLTKEEEKHFEDSLGLGKGTLAKSSNYWQDFKIRVDAKGTVLDLSDDSHLLKYKVLLADKNVAKSVQELSSNPSCDLMIIRQEDKAKVSLEKRSYKIQAMAMVSSFSEEDFVNAYLMLAGVHPKNLEPSIIRDYVEEFAEIRAQQFVNKIGDKFYKDKLLIVRLIDEGIIEKTGRGLNAPLRYNDLVLGNSIEDAIQFLNEPRNSSIFVEIMGHSKKKVTPASLQDRVEVIEGTEKVKTKAK